MYTESHRPSEESVVDPGVAQKLSYTIWCLATSSSLDHGSLYSMAAMSQELVSGDGFWLSSCKVHIKIPQEGTIPQVINSFQWGQWWYIYHMNEFI